MGEDLFYALLRVVPAAWNGEVLAAAGLFAALHPSVFGSDWMPYEYVPAYLAFLVAVASVGGGRSGDCWIAALSGWILIHGHVCFLFIVPFLFLRAVTVRLLPFLRRQARPQVGSGCDSGGRTPRGALWLTQPYSGYFYWSAPVLMLLVILLAGTESLAERWSAPRFAVGIVAALALAGCPAFAPAPLTRLATDHANPGNPQATSPVSDPSLPAGVARLGALTAGRYAVLPFPHGAWPAITGILGRAERSGVAACVADPWWEFMMTSRFICIRKEILAGVRFTVWAPDGVPRGMPVLVRLRRGIVTYGPK